MADDQHQAGVSQGTGRAPTLADVARHAGVSRSLASLALRGAPRVSAASALRIRAAAEALDYRPNLAARSLASIDNRQIGLIVGDVTNPLNAEVARNVTIAAHEAGFSSVVSLDSATDSRAAQAFDLLKSHGIAGVVMVGSPYEKPAIARIAQELPSVYIGRLLKQVAVDSVTTDHISGADLATRHLFDTGRRRIIHLGGGQNPGAWRMQMGYLRAMEDCGLRAAARIIDGAYTLDAGAMAAHFLLRGPDPMPDGIVACCDLTAVGFLSTIQKHGLGSPADISIVGYDDTSFSRTDCLSLSTIHQSPQQLAAEGVRLLTKRLRQPQTELRKVLVEPELVARRTSRP